MVAHRGSEAYALAARILGLIVDGMVPRQWLLVAVEVGVMAVVTLWMWRSGALAH